MHRKHILIVTNTDDAHANAIQDHLRSRTRKVHRLDSDLLASPAQNWRISKNPREQSHSSWFIPDIDTIWYRKIVLPEPVDTTQSFVHQELEGFLESILSQYEYCRWVNNRDCIRRARTKIDQLACAKNLGFRIPDTLITTDIDALEQFAEIHHGCIIAKPIQTQVIGFGKAARVLGTRKLTPEYFQSALALTPCYAQEQLALKAEIRVVVFGTELHAFRLIPQIKADDIKQLDLEQINHEICTLDKHTSGKIHALMKYYHLEFGAIDLGVVDDQEPIFLELNPNGQWLWLQYITGKNLIDPFIDLLCG